MSSDVWHDNALRIWRAGLDAVDSRRLVREHVRVAAGTIAFHPLVSFPLASIRRIVVVGAGKAGTGMVQGFIDALGNQPIIEKQLSGWVNVPAGCVPLPGSGHLPIVLHAGRPDGQNEPTTAGIAGAQQIMRLVQTCQPEDLVVCLLSGGASALMPLPVDGITWQDKLMVTRRLSAAGADIHELNLVRKQLSAIKGGGLRRACRANRLVTLTISDVLGDPLDVIGSGPTEENTTTPHDAWQTLTSRLGGLSQIPSAIQNHFLTRISDRNEQSANRSPAPEYINPAIQCHHLVIGNNATAVRAAIDQAEQIGYEVEELPTDLREPTAEQVGRKLLQPLLMRATAKRPWCLISGGEPTVELVPASQRGVGGRNQQLVLAALCQWLDDHASWTADSRWVHKEPQPIDWCLLSGGTDGEDGPTDAAGAILSPRLIQRLFQSPVRPEQFLHRNDAYSFFQQFDGLIKTGPTHTNVCDLRVALCRPGNFVDPATFVDTFDLQRHRTS